MLNDRIIRGSVAGMLGGLFINAIGLPLYFWLHFTKSLWVIHLSWIVLHHTPKSAIDWILAFIIFYAFCGILGALYSVVVIPQPESGNYIFRGILTGVITMMVVSALSFFLKIPQLSYTPWQTTVTFLIQVTGWGILVGILMRRWDKRMIRH